MPASTWCGRQPGEENAIVTEPLLVIDDLHVNVGDKPIVRGLSLTVNAGEVHAIMGPNGSGKSTLANALMGHPRYTITGGSVRYKGEEIVHQTPDERARAGMFLAFQYPTDVPGVSMINFLRRAVSARRGAEIPVKEFRKQLGAVLEQLQIDEQFVRRYVNDGFSGGEKKRAEILQLGLLEPELAIMDETDSGLDIDALRIVAEGINATRSDANAILLITHYQRMLNYISPDFVHVLAEGRIVTSGDASLSHRLEAEGYDPILTESVAQTMQGAPS
jgi:Fe-S cluster assembly ATP-binding protein